MEGLPFNILLTKPQLCNSYVAIDPNVWWDNEYILKKAKNKLDTLNLKGIKLYLAQADNKPTPEDNNRSHENAIVSNKIGFAMKPEEARVDWIANYCLETNRPKQAVEFFELNQKYYPDSINTYIVLGDYYAKISDFDKAKKEYRKVLKLDPKSLLVIKARGI